MSAITNNPPLNVAFINTINAVSTYGVTFANSRLGVADSLGVNSFPYENGTVDFRTINAPNLNGSIYTATSAATLSVNTPTAPSTLLANTVYAFTIIQINPYTGVPIILPVSYNSGTTNLTGASAVAAWEAIINVSELQVTLSATGGALTITSIQGYPIAYIPANTLVNITNPTVTAGVASKGESYDMEALNERGNSWSAYSGYIPTNNYAKYDMLYKLRDGSLCETIIFVNSGDANFANFQTQLLTDALQLGEGTPTAALIQPSVKVQS